MSHKSRRRDPCNLHPVEISGEIWRCDANWEIRMGMQMGNADGDGVG